MIKDANQTVTIAKSDRDRLLADHNLLTVMQANLVPLTEGLRKCLPRAVIGMTRVAANPGCGSVSPLTVIPSLPPSFAAPGQEHRPGDFRAIQGPIRPGSYPVEVGNPPVLEAFKRV